jgi:hypothetical protein
MHVAALHLAGLHILRGASIRKRSEAYGTCPAWGRAMSFSFSSASWAAAATAIALSSPTLASAQEQYRPLAFEPAADPPCDPVECEAFDKKGRPRKVIKPVEGFSPPTGYDETTRPVRRAWITGTAVLSGGWAFGAITSGLFHGFSGWFSPQDDAYLWGLVPVVGPFIATQTVDDPSDTHVGFMAASSVLQLGGLLTLAVGLSLEETIWVRDDVSLSLQVSPGLVGVGGTF